MELFCSLQTIDKNVKYIPEFIKVQTHTLGEVRGDYCPHWDRYPVGALLTY